MAKINIVTLRLRWYCYLDTLYSITCTKKLNFGDLTWRNVAWFVSLRNDLCFKENIVFFFLKLNLNFLMNVACYIAHYFWIDYFWLLPHLFQDKLYKYYRINVMLMKPNIETLTLILPKMAEESIYCGVRYEFS